MVCSSMFRANPVAHSTTGRFGLALLPPNSPREVCLSMISSQKPTAPPPPQSVRFSRKVLPRNSCGKRRPVKQTAGCRNATTLVTENRLSRCGLFLEVARTCLARWKESWLREDRVRLPGQASVVEYPHSSKHRRHSRAILAFNSNGISKKAFFL